jgi:homoserine dehydrogenase
LDYVGLADSAGCVLAEHSLDDGALRQALRAKADGRSVKELPGAIAQGDKAGQDILAWLRNTDDENVVLVDVTASLTMESVLLPASELGCGIVLANKRPLVGPLAVFRALTRGRRVRHEATVGAGLPVIHTIRYLQDTGDEITAVEGSLSGTMGYLCAELDEGVPFSSALAYAKAMPPKSSRGSGSVYPIALA